MFESYSSLISLHGVGKYEFLILCILIPLSKKKKIRKEMFWFQMFNNYYYHTLWIFTRVKTQINEKEIR